MANELNELTDNVNEQGRDINVIEKQIEVTIGFGSVLFEIFLWILIIPGLIFLFKKIAAKNYFEKLQQKLQHDASQIDNYLEQRVVILQNLAKLIEKSVNLDKETMTAVASLRSGNVIKNDVDRNNLAQQVDSTFSKINLAFEAYPELRSHELIAEAIRQNSYLQKEITAAREVYNDTVRRWNQDIFAWPTKRIVAARSKYTTRIPFTASKEIKEKAREVFF